MGLDVFENAHDFFVHERIGVRDGYVQQDVLRPRNEVVVQQRRAQRRLGHRLGAVVAFGHGHGHMGAAAVAHHLRDIGEIDVHQIALHGDDLGDALRRRCQDVVGLAEGLLEREAPVDLENVLVVDDEQRIDVLPQLLDAAERLLVTDLALDGQRRGDDGHRQQSHLPGQFGDDGRSARTRAAAYAGRDEDHLRTDLLELLADFGQRLDRGAAPVLGIVARAEPLGPEADFPLHGAFVQRLLVRVADHEGHAPDAEVPHVVHGVASGPADSDHRDNRPVRTRSLDFRHQFVCHIVFPNYPNNLNYPFSPAGKRVSAAFTNPALPQTPLLGGNLPQRSRGFSRDFDRNADERIRPKSPRPRPPRNSC